MYAFQKFKFEMGDSNYWSSSEGRFTYVRFLFLLFVTQLYCHSLCLPEDVAIVNLGKINKAKCKIACMLT